MIDFDKIKELFIENSVINNEIYLEKNISIELLGDILNNKPKSLFRYLSDEDYNELSILNNTVYCNNPKNFNDPYDCGFTTEEYINYKRSRILFLLKHSKDKFKGKTTSTTEELINILANSLCDNNLKFRSYGENEGIKLQLELFERNLRIKAEKEGKERDSKPMEIWDTIINYCIEQDINSHFICCFSATKNNLLLWSHYANKHTGYCVEYDISRKSNISERLFPVIYSLKKMKHDVVVNNFLLDIENNCGQLYTDFLLRKSYHWLYESEWRLIVKKSDSLKEVNGGLIVKFEPIKAIYFGLNMKESRKRKLYLKIKNQNKSIKFYSMTMNNESYDVKYEEYLLN